MSEALFRERLVTGVAVLPALKSSVAAVLEFRL